MKKILFFLFLSISTLVSAQSTARYNAQKYLAEGYKLHGLGELRKACQYYEEATKLDPQYYYAYYLWGSALSSLAGGENSEELYKEAFAKYKQATKIEKDNPSAYNDWGVTLMKYSQLKKKEKYYSYEIESLFKKAEKNGSQSGAYNLACLYSLLDNKKKAMEWLKKTMTKSYKDKMNTTLSRAVFDKDSDFDNIRESDEFIEFLNTNFPDQLPARYMIV